MSKITIDTDTLLKGASDISKQIAALQSASGSLSELIFKISETWIGDSSTGYINSMQSVIDKATQTSQAMEEYQKYVQDCAEKFSKLDKDSANKIRSCF